MWFQLPIRAEHVRRVTLNGQETQWHTVEGFGCTRVIVSTGKLAVADVSIELADRVPHTAPVAVEGKVGEQVRLEAIRDKVLRWQDLHDVVESPRTEGAMLQGSLANKPGHHMVWALVKVG